MIGVLFDPIDTLFFRDGTPFSSGSSSQTVAGGVFPPNPPSLTGALRVAIAQHNSTEGELKAWQQSGRWPKRMNEVLGDGPDNLGQLRFEGPLLVDNEEALFPMPRHVVGQKTSMDWTPTTFLELSDTIVCDLAPNGVRLPSFPSTIVTSSECSADDGEEPENIKKLEPGVGFWLREKEMVRVLNGQLPQKVINGRQLWSNEPRIGLEREPSTRTAKHGQLYTARHIRLQDGGPSSCRTRIGMRLSGLGDLEMPWNKLAQVGGERRLAQILPWESKIFGQSFPRKPAANIFALIALSPLELEVSRYDTTSLTNAVASQVSEALAGRAVSIVSACLDRPRRIGGWNSLKRSPLAMRSALPPGSILFAEVQPDGAEKDTSSGEPSFIQVGKRTAHGFGLMAIGQAKVRTSNES